MCCHSVDETFIYLALSLSLNKKLLLISMKSLLCSLYIVTWKENLYYNNNIGFIEFIYHGSKASNMSQTFGIFVYMLFWL